MATYRYTVPSRYRKVDDERIVVFFDGTDSVWGGCNDFVERYLRLERATGDQYSSSGSSCSSNSAIFGTLTGGQYTRNTLRMHCACAVATLHLHCISAASLLHLRCICAAGARLIMSAEMHCGGSTPTPPGCAGTPNPPPWIAGPMTLERARLA